MNNKIKVGVFGAYRGKTMINLLANHPNAELAAVCDKYKPLLDEVSELADKAGIDVALYDNYDDFEKHDMDAVVLANYATEHASYAVRLLKQGRHVLSEVLPCETMAQAVELIEAVEKSDKVYAFAENYCYMTSPFEMWRRYQKGDIGEVTYAQGEYVHDCSSIWPLITYGEKNHWRNNLYSTFYCTHSMGPILTITGRRPVQVVGFETPLNKDMLNLGSKAGGTSGIIIATLDNGAIVRSLHGGLKREPGSNNYLVYGDKGMMESDRMEYEIMSAYIEGKKLCEGEMETYKPNQDDLESSKLVKELGIEGHGGSDFYSTHFFIDKILGGSEGSKYSIDVYRAVDMGICGILAYRSILNGNTPVKVPNLRNKDERDAYRYDNACTDLKVAGDQLLPYSSQDTPEIDEKVYEYVRVLWDERKNAEKSYTE